MQAGTRNGEWTQFDEAGRRELTSEDLVNIIAYVSSRPIAPASNATSRRPRAGWWLVVGSCWLFTPATASYQ